MRKSILIFVILTAALFLTSKPASGQYIIQEGDNEGPVRSGTIILPYAFSSETLGFGAGIGGSYSSTNNPQSLYYGTAYVTDNGSWLGLIGGHNLQTPFSQRLYIRPHISLTQKTHMRIYVDGNPDFINEPPAGSNESSPDNYIEEDAYETTINLEFRYTLPWGHYKEDPIHTYITRNGILKENPSGAESINPLESGRSTILFNPFYRKVFTDVDELETLYFQFGFEHDNRDFLPNPHRGYKWNLNILHDFNFLQNTRNWTSLDGEFDIFIPLWETTWARQQTLALSCWSAYSPTYDPDREDNYGRPPYFAGPTLGGLWRLKGYPSNRFHDKAAIYYGAEYRIMPEWQPLGTIETLDPLMIRWWQFVLLAEIGRVAPEWDPKTLHSDMKYDAGIGIRGMFDKGIGRLDLVVSEEQVSIVAMFGHSF